MRIEPGRERVKEDILTQRNFIFPKTSGGGRAKSCELQMKTIKFSQVSVHSKGRRLSNKKTKTINWEWDGGLPATTNMKPGQGHLICICIRLHKQNHFLIIISPVLYTVEFFQIKFWGPGKSFRFKNCTKIEKNSHNLPISFQFIVFFGLAYFGLTLLWPNITHIFGTV